MNELEKYIISEDFDKVKQALFFECDKLLLEMVKKSENIKEDDLVNSINDFEKILNQIIIRIKK